MTTITQICTELVEAQLDQQVLHRAAHNLRDIKVSRDDLLEDYADCKKTLSALAERLTHFAAANDNTMVLGVA